MIMPYFLAVFVLRKLPEWLILLDLIATDNTLHTTIFISPLDVEDLIFSFFDKFPPLFLDPFHSRVVRGHDRLDLSHNDGLLLSIS